MRLVDTHTHTWGDNTSELPWIGDGTPPNWEGPYTHCQLISDMDRLGIDESVIVSMPMYGRKRGNEYTMRSIEAHPDRLYGVGFMDYFVGSTAVRNRLRQVTGHPRMIGVRMYAALEYGPVPGAINRGGDWFLDDRLDPFFDEAASLDTSIFIFPKVQQLIKIEELIKRHPDVQFIVDHMAWIDETITREDDAWMVFEDIAKYDNVLVKISSVPRSAMDPWPYDHIHPYLHDLIQWFGPERLMLGSDYPWMNDWATYEECLHWIDAVEFLSRKDRLYLQYRTFDQLIS